jgi:predicted membrane chloride channel (bestrophin family)
LRIILELKGSVLYSPGNFIAGLVLAAVNVLLQYLIDSDSDLAPKIANNYGMSALGVVVAFSVVFRTNLGWQRYWEALGQVSVMYSKWQDAVVSFMAFANSTIHRASLAGGEQAESKIQRVLHLRAAVSKHFCILSAIAADRLAHGDTESMDAQASVARWSEQVLNRKALHRKRLMDSGTMALPSFKLMSVSGEKDLTEGRPAWQHEYEVTHLPSEQEVVALKKSRERVAVCLYWVLFDLAEASRALDIAPPIQTRIFQEVSNGMLGYVNAMKISDVPFPFPFAQMCSLLIVVFSCFIPVYMACFTQSMIAGPILTFVLFETIWCINEVSKDLENPFGNSMNDIQLDDFHCRFLGFLNEIESAHLAATSCSKSPHALQDKEQKSPVSAKAFSLRTSPTTAMLDAGASPSRKSTQIVCGPVACSGANACVPKHLC